MIRAFKQFTLRVYRSLIPSRFRNSLRLWLMLDVPDLAPRLIDDFDSRPVLVLAPHMDDEIIGPGGTVVRHVRAGAPVTFVVMTSDHRAQIRKAESTAAAKVVGVSDLIFLEGPDGSLDDSADIVNRLVDILSNRKPAIVYLPSPTDYHRDHWATNRILRKALDSLSPELTRNLLIRGYEVWTPLPANRMVDISPSAEEKRQAIAAFASQVKLVDYSRTILGLNQYRSMMHLQGQGFAEAFLECTPDEFRRWIDAISLKKPFEAR